MHCFCVCSRSALLGDLTGVSRSVEWECNLLSVLSYPRFFLSVSCNVSSFARDVLLLCYCTSVSYAFVVMDG